jgi:hypothetical protein
MLLRYTSHVYCTGMFVCLYTVKDKCLGEGLLTMFGPVYSLPFFYLHRRPERNTVDFLVNDSSINFH